MSPKGLAFFMQISEKEIRRKNSWDIHFGMINAKSLSREDNKYNGVDTSYGKISSQLMNFTGVGRDLRWGGRGFVVGNLLGGIRIENSL